MAGKLFQIDAVVQSLDKNFLVPVGGAVIVTFVKDDIASISNVYAGLLFKYLIL